MSIALSRLRHVGDILLIVLLAPVLAAAFLIIGIGSLLILAVQRLTGLRDGAETQTAYHPAFERFGKRPTI